MNRIRRQQSTRPVAVWLFVGVLMIIGQIILGGITRLTDSGLSITEWKPILGAVPPISSQQWQEAFNHYKQIAQYKHLHAYFTLADFKAIYFWEWLHRLWGRLIGVVFLIPFVIFLLQRRFRADMIRPMVVLFLLGGLQGLVGWLMVMSGLNEENIYVSHIRLAIHFILALILLVYTFWFALQLSVAQQQRIYLPSSRSFINVLLVLLTLQLIYGAFMAGLKAAPAAPTWPDMNGSYFPSSFTQYEGHHFSFLSALVNNPIAIHFIHRNLAYVISLLILAWTITVIPKRGSQLFTVIKWLPLLLVAIQVTLGIMTVLASPQKTPQHWGIFEWYAQLHQFVAILLLLSLVVVRYVVKKVKS
jgi:heme a synthase